jgi:hypothetical protein
MDLLNLCHVQYMVIIACVHAVYSNTPGLMFLNFVSFQHQTGSYFITAAIILALRSSTQIECSCFSEFVVYNTLL